MTKSKSLIHSLISLREIETTTSMFGKKKVDHSKIFIFLVGPNNTYIQIHIDAQ